MDIYKDQSYSFKERAADLVSKMTLEEKIMQVGNNAAAIPRLGVPAYNYWSEASHGFFGPFKYKNMDVTSYPVCLAMSQSWDGDKIEKVTTAISDEIRAYHNTEGDELHMWCPTINMARDPRNGRSDENFGEDPYLAGTLSARYIQGMQGHDEKYLKTVSTPKHYALNSSENNRHSGSANVDEATLREYYIKAFEMAIKEGGAESIMTSYNRVNGVPASVSDQLLTTFLREEWGFDGFVVSDCGAIADCYVNPMFATIKDGIGHYYCKSLEEASAASLIAGTDMSCGNEHKKALMNALKQGLIDEAIIDRSIIRALISRFRLGLFDDQEKVSYHTIGRESICSDEMKDLAVDIANDSIVLLKNENILPIQKDKVKRILVVGANAIYRELGGYSAGQTPCVDAVVNILALKGIKNEVKGSGVEVLFEKGWCSDREFGKKGIADILPGFDPLDMMLDIIPEGVDPETAKDVMKSFPRYTPEDPDYQKSDRLLMKRAVKAAKEVDIVVVIAGTDATNGSEEHDRETLDLPYGQDEKIQQLVAANPNTVVVLTALGTVTGAFFDKVPAILNTHFGGQEQGTAIANVLFGKVNPSAKLTTTWYKDLAQLPSVNDYNLRRQDTVDYKARTYMFFDGEVNYPFGFGLSYTNYEYGNIKIAQNELDANDTLKVSVDVSNTGKRDGSEIVQLYVSKIQEEKKPDNKAIRQLKGFEKVFFKAGERKTVVFDVPVSELAYWNNLKKKMTVESGRYTVSVGSSSVDLPCVAEVTVSGEWKAKLSSIYTVCDKYVYEVGQIGNIKVSATLNDKTHLCCCCDCDLVYTSSNEDVATVDEKGKMTAKGSGTAIIAVEVTYDGVQKSSTAAIAVK